MAADQNLSIDMRLENISRQPLSIIIPPRIIDDNDASPAPSEYEGSARGFSPVRVSRLDFVLGRPWNRDDTITIFTRIGVLENIDHELTDYEREAIMHRVILEYLENQMALGPEWDNENMDDLYDEFRELLHDTWNVERLLEDDEIGDRGLSLEIITKNLQTRVCGINVDRDEVCAICCDEFCREKETKIGVLNCGHDYHVNCIQEWLLKNNICPLCRAQALERT